MANANYWTQTFLGTCTQAGNTPVRVAIIDGGIYTATGNTPQNALLNRYYDPVNSVNFTTETDNYAVIQDKSETLHGTRVAGVIAQIYDNLGMNAAVQKLTIFKAFNQQGEAELWDILKAIDKCIEQRIQIVNLSFNYNTSLLAQVGAIRPKLLIETAINIAKNYNILFVTAAGNESANVDANTGIGYFPTNFASDNLLKVAADSSSMPAVFSNYGANSVDIAAPGIVVVAGRNDTLIISSGTSFAAPIVTALAAVEASKGSSFDWYAVKQALRNRFKPTIPLFWQGKLKAGGGVLKPLCD
jgi:subtilisin family serine protease